MKVGALESEKVWVTVKGVGTPISFTALSPAWLFSQEEGLRSGVASSRRELWSDATMRMSKVMGTLQSPRWSEEPTLVMRTPYSRCCMVFSCSKP